MNYELFFGYFQLTSTTHQYLKLMNQIVLEINNLYPSKVESNNVILLLPYMLLLT